MADVDETEDIRRAQVAQVNADPGSREALEAQYGQVWTLDELTVEYEILGFMAPYVVARHRKTGTKGSFMFQHRPRFYFAWTAEDNG